MSDPADGDRSVQALLLELRELARATWNRLARIEDTLGDLRSEVVEFAKLRRGDDE